MGGGPCSLPKFPYVSVFPHYLLICSPYFYISADIFHMCIVGRGDWLGKPANFKGVGYCLCFSRSREHDRARLVSTWRR